MLNQPFPAHIFLDNSKPVSGSRFVVLYRRLLDRAADKVSQRVRGVRVQRAVAEDQKSVGKEREAGATLSTEVRWYQR